MRLAVLDYTLCLIEYAMIFGGLLNHLLVSRMRRVTHRLLLPVAIIFCGTIVYACGSLPVYFRCIVALLVALMWAGILYRDIVIQQTLVVLSIYIFYIVDIVIGNLIALFFDEHFIEVFYSSFPNRIIINSIIKVVDAFVFYNIYIAFKNIKFRIRTKEWMLFDIIAFVFLAVTVVFISLYPSVKLESSATLLFLAMSLGFCIMSGIVVYFFTELCGHFQEERKLYFLESTNTALQQHMMLQDHMVEKLRKFRHDMKNHLATVRGLLGQQQYEEASAYVSELNADIGHMQFGIEQSCGNSVIDAVVNFKAALCEKMQIPFHAGLEPLPEIPYPITNLSALLSNLLDNAIEAAKNTNHPFVDVKIFMYKGYMTFTARNPYYTLVSDNGKLQTTKPNKAYHGYGTQIITEIAERYGGNFSYTALDGIFTATIILPIQY